MSHTATAISVLHVDDDQAFLDLAVDTLEHADDRFSVDTATRASEALEDLEGGEYDCVVSDYEMPGLDGIEFLKRVREDRPDLPFILFTGEGGEAVASDAISAGATDYLQKGGADQFELLANRVENAVEQYRAVEHATELERVRALVSDVNQALVRADSRSTAERRVCEIFSDSDPYLFAWIGAVDSETGEVVPRAWAGVEEGYLDGITVTVDESATGQGPGGTAIRERRVAVSQDVQDDPAFEPWREAAVERGYDAVAAVPLSYEDTLYGELVVYADRPHAFDAAERDLLAELGTDVGHVVHAFEVRDQLRAERDRRRALFENAPEPVIEADIETDEDRHLIADVNDAFESVFGRAAEDVVGRDVAEVIVPGDDADDHRAFRERAADGDTVVAEVERETGDGPRRFLLHVIPYGVSDGRATGTYAWYTDVTERQEREATIRELHRTASTLIEAETSEAVAEITVDTLQDILDMPANGVHLYEEEGDCLRPVAWTDRGRELAAEIPTFQPGDGLAWEVFESGEAQVYRDVSEHPRRYEAETDVRSEMVLPLGDHGVLLVGSSEPDAFDEMDRSLAETLAAHVTTALDHLEDERALARQRSMLAAQQDAILDGVLVVDDDGDVVSYNERFVDLWDVPEAVLAEGGQAVLDWVTARLAEPDTFRERVEALSEASGATARDEVELADGRVFDWYTTPLTDDGTRFGRLWTFRDLTGRKDREQELERQNERLEEFASVVSHDLRNPLNVAAGRIDLAREACDCDHLEDAASAIDRMDALIEDLLTLAREGNRVSDVEPVDLEAVVENCWANVETADATLSVESGATVEADPSRLKQLLENLVRNAVEHGGTGVTVTVGDWDDGFYVADDGRGIPPEERDDVFDRGYSTSTDGTGFGLVIVEQIAEAHGWTIDVTESEAGGARFDVGGVETA